jgi:hypothetical protein
MKPEPRDSELGPIGAYVRELEGRLGARRLLRRRVLSEVRNHLRESAEDLQRRPATTRAHAEREAVARFGDADELARGLRTVRGRRSLAAHRLVTLWIAWAAAMAMGSATVWAAVDLQSQTARRAGQPVGAALRAEHARLGRLFEADGLARLSSAGEAAAPTSRAGQRSAPLRARCDTDVQRRPRRCGATERARTGQ